MRHSNLLWILFFVICVGVGFLHGYLPQGISKNFFIHPTKIRVLTTDELLFPKELRTLLEDELYIKLEVTVTRDWNALLATTIASPAQDLVFLPSYWATTLRQQNLLSPIFTSDSDLTQKVSSDFLDNMNSKTRSALHRLPLDFIPIYWLKTGFLTNKNQGFTTELKDTKIKNLFLLADEDLILEHFLNWKSQGLNTLLSHKKILTLQLDQLNSSDKNGIFETTLNELHPQLQTDLHLSALLIWGASIPTNAENKELALEILNILTSASLQEKVLMQTPFNSTLLQVTDANIPEQRKAGYLRRIQLKNTILIDKKDIDAKKRLKDEFGFIL